MAAIKNNNNTPVLSFNYHFEPAETGVIRRIMGNQGQTTATRSGWLQQASCIQKSAIHIITIIISYQHQGCCPTSNLQVSMLNLH